MMSRPLQRPSSVRRRGRAISFDKLEIYGFPKILGDNPCAEGAPLGLDCCPDYQLLLTVEEHEKRRPRRRSVGELRLSSTQRKDYLLAAGYTTDDVADAASRNKQARRNRWESYHAQKWEIGSILLEYLQYGVAFVVHSLKRKEVANTLSLLLMAYTLSAYYYRDA